MQSDSGKGCGAEESVGAEKVATRAESHGTVNKLWGVFFKNRSEILAPTCRTDLSGVEAWPVDVQVKGAHGDEPETP